MAKKEHSTSEKAGLECFARLPHALQDNYAEKEQLLIAIVSLHTYSIKPVCFLTESKTDGHIQGNGVCFLSFTQI